MIRKSLMAGLGLLGLAMTAACLASRTLEFAAKPAPVKKAAPKAAPVAKPAKKTKKAKAKKVSVREDVRAEVRTVLNEELREMLTAHANDYEWRYKQARDLYKEMGVREDGRPALRVVDQDQRQLTAEDFNDLTHRLTGYTINNGTNGTPAGTSTANTISWATLHIIYAGVDYTVADGVNVALKYIYFTLASVVSTSATTGTVTLASSATKPTLGKDDIMVFLNGGPTGGTTIVSASDGHGSLPAALADNTVDSGALINGAASGAKVGAILSSSIGTGIINSNLQFSAGVIDNNALGSLAVTGAKVAAGTLAAGKLNTLTHILF